MSHPSPSPATNQDRSRTRIVFDLRDELSASEIEAFEHSARAAGTSDLTEHFLNVAVRLPQPARPSKP